MMNTTDNLTGDQLRDKGIAESVGHADKVIDNWSADAYEFLENYCKTNIEFMIEEVRSASIGILPEPPNSRAWGAIATKAVRNHLIIRKGYRNVTNSKAHSTPATVWSLC